MIVVSKNEILNIDQLIVQEAIKTAYQMMDEKRYNMPDRMHVADGENMLLLMPCFSDRFFATKLVSVFPGAQNYGEPAVNGIVVLNDNQTGKPLALMDGASLTAQRTGAVGGLAIDLLTPRNLRTAGLLGAGVQGYQQARYALCNRKVDQFYIFDLNQDLAESTADRLRAEFDFCRYSVCSSAIELVEKSEAVIAATTSKTPLFEAPSELIHGKVFISIGSFQPDMQEFPDAVCRHADRIFADTLFARKESGDLAGPLHRNVITPDSVTPFCELLQQPIADPGTYFFKSVGMALFDLCVATAVFEAAKAGKIGKKIKM